MNVRDWERPAKQRLHSEHGVFGGGSPIDVHSRALGTELGWRTRRGLARRISGGSKCHSSPTLTELSSTTPNGSWRPFPGT